METFAQICEWGGVLRLAMAAGFSSAGTFRFHLPLESAMAAHVPLQNCTLNLDVLEGAFQSDVDGSTPPAKLARRALSSQAICDVAFAGEASWVASNWPVGNVSTRVLYVSDAVLGKCHVIVMLWYTAMCDCVVVEHSRLLEQQEQQKTI